MRRVFGAVEDARTFRSAAGDLHILNLLMEEQYEPAEGTRLAVFEVSDDAPVGMDLSVLSPAKRRVVIALVDLTEERGFAPTVTELADTLDLAKATVHHHLHDLKALGWLLGGEGVRTWRLA